MMLAPQIEGSAPIHSTAVNFLESFRQRIEAGLLTGKPHPRSRYRVTGFGPGHLAFEAEDWWSAVNVGLNQVELRIPRSGSVQYRVRYRRWASFALGFCGALGLLGLVLLLTLDVRGYIARQPGARLPGLSLEQNVAIAWAMVLFWGFVWPWLLIVLHKGPLHRLVARLVAEVDAAARGA
jgi:hypothetical protein